MLFAPRVPTKQLAEFLRRLSMSLEVGIDIRKALTSEAGTLHWSTASAHAGNERCHQRRRFALGGDQRHG